VTELGPSLGVTLAQTAKTVSRAFDAALTAAGGSQSGWLILLSLKTLELSNQRELAEAVGIQGATLTHHLNTMEDSGLVCRRRAPGNRRVQVVELTERGDELFQMLSGAAIAHDRRLCAGLSDEEIALLSALLDRLRRNVVSASGPGHAPAIPPGPDAGSGARSVIASD
jgi:MarR family transcriptional regulator, transcriptional regulator for hemolysin